MKNSLFDAHNIPPAAKLLGWRLNSLDPKAGTIEVQFEGNPAFSNSFGVIQGGFLSAMLDDTLGPAAFAMSGGRLLGQTIDLHVHFLRPVRPGPITTRASVTKLGKSIAYMEGELFDQNGKLAARATASAYLREMKPGVG